MCLQLLLSRLESVERLIVESQQRFPHDIDAGIEFAMREMESVIAEAEQGHPEAVAEVRWPLHAQAPLLRLGAVCSKLLPGAC